MSNDHILSPEEWTVIHEAYSETYPVRPMLNEICQLRAELKESRERCAEQTRKVAELAQAVIDCQTWTANVERHVTGIHRAEITSLRAELAECRRALEECRAALYGAIGVCGNIGNIQHAINLATAALAGKGEGEKHE